MVVPAVDLVQVDVVGTQAAEAGVDVGHDRLARQALLVGPAGAFPHVGREEHLGGDHGFFAAGELLKQFAEDDFRSAGRVAVGGVEEVDALLHGVADDRAAVGFAEGPGVGAGARLAEGHAAQAQFRNIQAGVAQLDVLHLLLLGGRLRWGKLSGAVGVRKFRIGAGELCRNSQAQQWLDLLLQKIGDGLDARCVAHVFMHGQP
ncbi:hypothetical protein D3C76_1324400 [compost metagenome]